LVTQKADAFECFKYLASKVTNEIVVSGIGFFEWLGLTAGREANLSIGQMGTTVPLAFGIAINLPYRKVLCLTTDGDLLMELGALPPLGKLKPNNLAIIVNDNEHYQQTHAGENGYWPTFTGSGTDLEIIAKGCGIENSTTVTSTTEFASQLDRVIEENKLSFTVLKTEPSKLKVFRPDIDHIESKYRFARYMERSERLSILPKEQQDRALLEMNIKALTMVPDSRKLK
jgi:thiamine pyrophosphate-dependent acetolactate synthase large subunit-like protein